MSSTRVGAGAAHGFFARAAAGRQMDSVADRAPARHWPNGRLPAVRQRGIMAVHDVVTMLRSEVAEKVMSVSSPVSGAASRCAGAEARARCPRCHAAFDCTRHAQPFDCWCASMPPLPAARIDRSAGCLCPECLAGEIARAARPDSGERG